MSKGTFSNKVKEQAYDRSEGCCEICYVCIPSLMERSPHHVFFKSQYFKEDKNDLWNSLWACRTCHYKIHNPANKEERKYDRDAKDQAIKRAREAGIPESHVEELVAIRNGRHGTV